MNKTQAKEILNHSITNLQLFRKDKITLKDVEKWAIECKRILADNGTLFWYGHAKRIAYAQIIFDKHFNLINNLVWNKGSFMGLEESEGEKFCPSCQRIFNENDFIGNVCKLCSEKRVREKEVKAKVCIIKVCSICKKK